MTAGPTSPATKLRALCGAEWLAENAYIAPGFHRLLTAGGLTLGLWGGRHFMDVVTARNATTGDDITLTQTPEIMRPIHGIMRYNGYSDQAADRWKFVVDRMAPVALGAVTAYWGGKLFFHGKLPGKESFSAVTAAAKKAWAEGKISTDVADIMLRGKQSDATRKLAAGTLSQGSAVGTHIFGAFFPFTNSGIATSFQLGADRNVFFPFMAKLNRWMGNYGTNSRGFYSAMGNTTKWIEANVTHFNRAEDWAHSDLVLARARDGLQKFPERSAADEQRLASGLRKFIDDAYAVKAQHAHLPTAKLGEKIYDFVSGKTNPTRGLRGQAYDHFLKNHGFDLSKIKLASGPFQFFARLTGSRANEQEIMRDYGDYLKKIHGYNIPDSTKWAQEQLMMTPWKVTAAYTGGAAAVGAALVGVNVAHAHEHKKSERQHKKHLSEQGSKPELLTQGVQNNAANNRSSNLVDWVNGKPLDVAHWVSRVLITPPSMHRFMNAAYLSLVLFGGMKFANILTGRKLTKVMSGVVKDGVPESIMPLADVWAPFKPLHGLLAYTPGSAEIADRARQAAHFIIPVGLGMFGTYGGSYLYFKDRIKSLENPNTLEDYADRISMEQSKVYAGATAITSILNTGSGIHLLPVFNYSSNLHNRFLMGSGQQVAMPVLGKWWSGNAGTTPWGVKRSLNFMSDYLTKNPVARPREMPALVHSVIGKLYPDLRETELLDKKQIMLDRIYDVRDSYLAEGAVPASKRAALGTAMKTLLSGVGFEALLREAELDPAKANLASNGASGAIANFFGKRSTVFELTQEYRQKFTARVAKDKPATSSDFLRQLLDHSTAANDNGTAQSQPSSFTARLKTQPTGTPVLGG